MESSWRTERRRKTENWRLGRIGCGGFISWDGYNFEDAIIISERLLKDDWYSSIHIEDFSIDVRDTKLGPEVVTRDIPNIGEERLKNLDETGLFASELKFLQETFLSENNSERRRRSLSSLKKDCFARFARSRKTSKTLLSASRRTRKKLLTSKYFHANRRQVCTWSYQADSFRWRSFEKFRSVMYQGRYGNKGVISRIARGRGYARPS